jgi:hypothetical protein
MLSLNKILTDKKHDNFLVGSGGPINNNERIPSYIAIIANDNPILIDFGPETSCR